MSKSAGYFQLRKLFPDRSLEIYNYAKVMKLDYDSVYRAIYDTVLENSLFRQYIDDRDDYPRLIFLAALGKNVLALAYEMDIDFNSLHELLANAGDYDLYSKVGMFISGNKEVLQELEDITDIFWLTTLTSEGLMKSLQLPTEKLEDIKELILGGQGVAGTEYAEMRKDKKLYHLFRDLVYMLKIYPQFIVMTPSQLVILPSLRKCFSTYYSNDITRIKELEYLIIDNYVEKGKVLCDFIKRFNPLKDKTKTSDPNIALDPNELIVLFDNYILEKKMTHLNLQQIARLENKLGSFNYARYAAERDKRFKRIVPEKLPTHGTTKEERSQRRQEIKRLETFNKRGSKRAKAYQHLLIQIIMRHPEILECYSPEQLAQLNLSEQYTAEELFNITGYAYLATTAAIKANEQEMETSIKCKSCGKSTVTYSEAQTRSADEPMTIFYHCTNCGIRWRG